MQFKWLSDLDKIHLKSLQYPRNKKQKESSGRVYLDDKPLRQKVNVDAGQTMLRHFAAALLLSQSQSQTGMGLSVTRTEIESEGDWRRCRRLVRRRRTLLGDT